MIENVLDTQFRNFKFDATFEIQQKITSKIPAKLHLI